MQTRNDARSAAAGPGARGLGGRAHAAAARVPLLALALSSALLASASPALGQTGKAPAKALRELLAQCGQTQASPAPAAYSLPSYLARGLTSPDFRPGTPLDALLKLRQAAPQDDPRAPDFLLAIALASLWQADASAEPARGQLLAQAIETLTSLVRDYPRFQHCDQALLLLGRVLLEDAARGATSNPDSEIEQARRVFRQLIRDYPNSLYVPIVYTQFGDHFFAQGAMEEAAEFYERAAQYQAPYNTVYGYVLYRLAWCRLNLQDRDGAMNRFAALIAFLEQNPSSPEAAELGRRARLEICLAR